MGPWSGTRSRSGGVERRLKLGLAGTGLEAFARTTQDGDMQRVFFVPATINYLLTLEAETLIDDFLQDRSHVDIDIAEGPDRIGEVWERIGAVGDLDAAKAAFLVRHNAD